MTTALFLCAPELLSCLATVAICYLMIAAYAVIHDGGTLAEGLLWLAYRPFAWLSAQAKSAATSVSATGSSVTSSAGSFSDNEIAALKKLAHDFSADAGLILRGGSPPKSQIVTAPKSVEAAPVVTDAAPSAAGRIPA